MYVINAKGISLMFVAPSVAKINSARGRVNCVCIRLTVQFISTCPTHVINIRGMSLITVVPYMIWESSITIMAMLSFPTLAFGDLLHNLPFLMRAGHGRITWIQEGNTSHSIRHCLALFHRLTDPLNLYLMMLFEDILVLVVGPFVSTVQLHLEPSSLNKCMEAVLRTISRFEKAILRTRIFFRVVALCRQSRLRILLIPIDLFDDLG